MVGGMAHAARLCRVGKRLFAMPRQLCQFSAMHMIEPFAHRT